MQTMDPQKLLSSVKSLNDYIAATEKVVSKCENIEIQLNITTVLNLKKVRSLEIEYFSKCDDNGAALAIFERLLKHPPSKTWGLLGKELTATILYWLDAVRRHLISHSLNWWTFLKTILRFIKDMKSKHPSLPGIIVEQTTECLLDLSCNNRLDEIQRHEILHTVNECSAESSRELRIRMKDQLSGYFIKLSRILPTCGHFPTQTSILENLLRWLVGRYDPQVRRAAAGAWFPHPLYRRSAVEWFLERTWADFYQDARQFLNLQNENRPDHVTSTVCKELTFGSFTLVNGPQSRQTWLDINAASRTVSITLDPSVLEGWKPTDQKSFETLVVNEENVFSVQLYRLSSKTKLSLHLLEPLQMAAAPGTARDLTAALGSRQLATVDEALRRVFRDKYRVLMNVDEAMSSPEDNLQAPSTRQVKSADEIWRSNVSLRRRRQSGFAVRSRDPLQWNSPSTASTTSLALLHEKLAALPPLNYCNKGPTKISAQPELSMVREVSEGDEFSFSQSSASRKKKHGVCISSCVISDSDVRTYPKQKDAPPVTQKKDKLVSSMLIATLGSTDESFINDTFEKLTTNNPEFDLVDLLVKEALQNGPEKNNVKITIDKKTQESEVIENTPIEKQVRTKKQIRNRNTKCTVISNSTTDESNTEPVNEVNETPCFVTDRKKRLKSKDNNNGIAEECKKLDAAAVDAFFSQHAENAARSLVISPTLAKKLNETSSDVSECEQTIIDKELIKHELTFEADIIDCLNNMVDKVCDNLEKYAEMLSKEQMESNISEIAKNVEQNQNINRVMLNEPEASDNITSNDDAGVVTLRYPRTKKRVPKKNIKKKNPSKNKKADTTSYEEEVNVFIEDTNTNSPVNKPNTSLIRKRRKLYSPKDADNNMDKAPSAKVESRPSMETPIATCYKELEKAHKTRSRIPRKLTTASTETSPKTKELNDMFDKLKENVDNEENVTLVKRKSNKKDETIYNWTSDSEDEDFKKKKEVQKCVSKTSLESTATKRGRTVNRINYSEGNHNSSSDETKRSTKKRKVVKQNKPRNCKVAVEHSIDLIDERMREAPKEVLETSFVKETTVEKIVPDPEPSIAHVPEVEIIPENINDSPTAVTALNKLQRKKKAETLQIKKDKKVKKEKGMGKKDIVERNVNSKDNGSDSSLPGLVVESEQPRKDVMSSSLEADLLQKLKKIYSEGPDIEELNATQNLLLRADNIENSHVNKNDENVDLYDNNNCADVLKSNDLENHFEIIDHNQSTLYPKEITTKVIELSGSPSEKSIETVGKSPITGHNDLDESPPGMALLQEKFKDRDLEIQDMNQSFVDFYVQLKSALQSHRPSTDCTDNEKTDLVVTPSRLSSKEQAMTPKSSISNPRVVLTKMPTNEIKKYVSPVKSQKTNSTMSSASVVLKRISSDEINRWLPMPPANREDVSRENPKKYNTRLATKKPKRINKKTPEKKVTVQKLKTIISPIRLSFDVLDNMASSNSSAKENLDVGNLHMTRFKTKSLKTLKCQEIKKDFDEGVDFVERHTRRESSSESIRPNSVKRLENNIKDGFGKGRNVHTSGAPKNDGSEDNNEHTSESARSIASVNEWFKKRMLSSQTSSNKAKSNDAIKDIVGKVMETLETTLSEINQSTGKKLALMFMENQKHINNLQKDLRAVDERISSEVISGVTRLISEKFAERDQRFREMIVEFEKYQNERACDVLRKDNKQKILMVGLLQEDLQAVLDFINSQNKE